MQVRPDLYAGLTWRMIGPFRAGKVNAVAGIPGNPALVYFGADGGGVWKTTDGGVTWAPMFDGQPTASIGALMVAPSNSQIIYAGTGVNSIYPDITYGKGVFKSIDGGVTWQHLGLDDTRHIARILVDPRNPDLVLVAAMGHTFGPNTERGVFRSLNGGRTWSRVLYHDDRTAAVDLCFEPGNPRVVYATLWQGEPRWEPNTGSSSVSFGPGSGLYKSTDEGATWRRISGHGLPTGDWGRSGVAVAAGTRGQRVYVIVETKEPENGLYRSDDAGATWHRASADGRITGFWYFSEVVADPGDPEVMYVPKQVLYRSSDGGRTFSALKGAPGGDDYHTLWIDPTNSSRIVLGTDQGVTISLNHGASWSPWFNQPTGQFYRVATDRRYPYWIYGPQQDSGTVAIASRGNNGQITERDWFPVGFGESGYTIPDPLDPDIVYNAGPSGAVIRLSKTTGQARDISPAPALIGAKYRFNWTIPLAFSPQDAHLLYLGTQMLLKSTNAGTSWEAISRDLTRTPADAKEPERRLGAILTVAPSPVKEGVIWVGTDDGNIQVTQDAGATWTNVTPPVISPLSSIDIIEASHFDADTAYAAANRNALDDLRPHILRTRDFGRSWQEVVSGIGEMDLARAVREDPVRRGLLYAATETGVYVSFDDGGHWQSLRLNMPVVSVHDLAIEQDDLVAATYGRGFWILDDVTPLREVADGFDDSTPRLFKPRPAIRVRRDENQAPPLPPEVPAGKNPPEGAILHYYLPSKPPADVTLDVFDSDGTLVRRFSSAPLTKTSDEPAHIADYWIRRPQPLSKEPGMHRFAWDLRYADPPAIHVQSPYNYPVAAIVGDTPEPPQGPLVLPGEYEVRFSVAGQVFTQRLRVTMDPRVAVARHELQSSLGLQMKVADALERNFDAVQQVKDVRRRLTEHTRRSAADPVARAAKGLDEKTTLLLGEPGSPSIPSKAVTLMTLNESLISLMALLDGADSEPSDASLVAFQRMSDQLSANLSAWQELKAKELKALNAVLAEHKLAVLPAYSNLNGAQDERK